MTAVVSVSGLRKQYRSRGGKRTDALGGIDFEIPGPGVYGLLGPNGSGKTTTIRCLLGLVKPTAGTISVLGHDVSELSKVVDRIGALVEGPKFSPGFSGRKNLQLFASMTGVPAERIDIVLDMVELTDRADDNFESYSLGMGQRLGIAAAMLNNPELVILDEPTNGLDPAGVADIRRLVRKLAAEGRTVLVSSHQLHEVEQVCDWVVIFQGGRVLSSGPVSQILDGVPANRIVVKTPDYREAIFVLSRNDIDAHPTANRLGVELVLPAGLGSSDINKMLAHEGIFASSITDGRPTLEDAFLTLTTTSIPAEPPALAGTKIKEMQ